MVVMLVWRIVNCKFLSVVMVLMSWLGCLWERILINVLKFIIFIFIFVMEDLFLVVFFWINNFFLIVVLLLFILWWLWWLFICFNWLLFFLLWWWWLLLFGVIFKLVSKGGGYVGKLSGGCWVSVSVDVEFFIGCDCWFLYSFFFFCDFKYWRSCFNFFINFIVFLIIDVWFFYMYVILCVKSIYIFFYYCKL